MSVDSAEELKRQIEDAQTSEFDEWLKGFEENAEEDETGEESATSQESSHANPSEESLYDIHEAVKGYSRSSLSENVVDINEPWKYIPSAEVEVRSRMLANLDRQLEFQARRRKDAHEKFQKKWDKTLQKQDILVHALAKFSVLFNDCKDKREISRHIYNVTSDEVQFFTNLIKSQTAHSRHLSLLLMSLANRKKNYQPVRDFLNEVKELSEGKFADVTQVINRAAILENIRLRLIVTEWESEKERGEVILERFGLDYKALKNMLRLSNEQSQLHTKKIILENEVKAMEDKLDAIKTQLRDKDVLVSQLKLCVNNLYAQLCRRLGIPPAISDSKPMQQLENINSLMNQLRFLRDGIYKSATVASDILDIEVDTRATEKLKLKLKLGFK